VKRFRRAFSLSEIAVACTVLSLALLACLQLFEWSSRAFLLAHLRSGLEGESRRIQASLQPDLRAGDQNTFCLIDPGRQVTGPDGHPLDRGAYALATLSDWSDPLLIDGDLARPRWNRYSVVYASLATPARLIKQPCTAGAPPYTGPLNDLSLRLNEDPALNPGAGNPLILSQCLEEFRVTHDQERGNVVCSFILRDRGGRKAGVRVMDERFQFSFSVRLQNSGAF